MVLKILPPQKRNTFQCAVKPFGALRVHNVVYHSKALHSEPFPLQECLVLFSVVLGEAQMSCL